MHYVLLHGITEGVREPYWYLRWQHAIERATKKTAQVIPITWDKLCPHLNGQSRWQDLGRDLLAIASKGVFGMIAREMEMARTPTVIAHSLGSILALAFLRAYDQPTKLLTIGSPLMRLHYYGLSELAGGITKPDCVTHWGNIWSIFDPVTCGVFGLRFSGNIPQAANRLAWGLHSSDHYVDSSAFRNALCDFTN
jgi:hypothetical protein